MSLFLGGLALGPLLVSGTGLWCLCKGSSPLPVGHLDCQMPECCVDCVLGLYAQVWSRSLCCELQVPRHTGTSV